MRYMLDTHICIHLIQKQPPQLLARFAELNQGDVVMSVVTFAELRHAVELDAANKAAAHDALARLQQFVPVMPFDDEAGIRYGELTAAVPSRRKNAFDRLIAAHALSLGLTLVTNNVAAFKAHAGLVVENWAAAR